MNEGEQSPKRLSSRLRRADDHLVPLLQDAARTVVRVLGQPLRAVRRWEDSSWFGVVARNRPLLAFVTVAIATAGAAVHLDRYPELMQAEARARAAAEQQTVRVPGESADGGSQSKLAGGAVEVGPPVGVDVGDYIADRSEELSSLEIATPIVAVVSFDTYLQPAAVLELLPESVTVRFAQYRIPAEGEPPLETEVVGGDLAASIDRAVETALEPIKAEAAEVEKLLESGTVQDEAYEADYRRRLEELRAVKNVLETGAPVVFAVVVEGPVEALRSLADAEEVRLVDPAPPETDLGVSAFYGVRPEDTERATYGRDVG